MLSNMIFLIQFSIICRFNEFADDTYLLTYFLHPQFKGILFIYYKFNIIKTNYYYLL